ncbi:L-carnitine dehydratase/bile acid-inducible protein F [Sterolibacterium denitrificans]|uniref:L-carnitine dehydratase/bile acid-inducible protein F n=2 Tax=Sterolibacterium denitrificans TaxID=157592 RepID=A0A7Z7HP79_9PROT|nr:CoA transferase [Sterolibacterium denitrificans]SMB21132.1 L-carnitine dehydratase/bile acid-inducible protein F [Sterolibacterium denitrificans]
MHAVDFSPLSGFVCALDADDGAADWADDYAARLLSTLGAQVRRGARPAGRHPAIAWAQSGAMVLTGRADGPPQMCPLPLASCVDGVARALTALLAATGGRWQAALPGVETLGERAALGGLVRQGPISAGGACRLLRAADGWLAVSLPRADDWDLLAAWLESESGFAAGAGDGDAAWQALAGLLRERPLAALIERGRLLGLALAAVADVADIEQRPAAWFEARRIATQARQRRCEPGYRPPLVVDLSSLWAGPLCSHLLQLAGARVIKVESRQRPDGARRGAADFYDLMNHGKASVALDFASSQGIAQLRALLARADIVIEASRPRALRQLGICAEDLIAANPRLSWLAISGHGRDAPQGEWIAYGDDAGVAAGLSGVMLDLTGEPMFCGDAIADPLTGWHAALAALAAYLGGGGQLVALALTDVARHCAQFRLPGERAALHARWRDWQAEIAAAGIDAACLPLPRRAPAAARPLGADTAAILQELGISC